MKLERKKIEIGGGGGALTAWVGLESNHTIHRNKDVLPQRSKTLGRSRIHHLGLIFGSGSETQVGHSSKYSML